MLKNFLCMILVLSNLSFASESSFYGNLQYTKLNYSNTGSDKDFGLDGYKLSFGYLFNDVFNSKETLPITLGIEGSISLLNSKSRETIHFKNGTVLHDASVDINALYATHLKATTPLFDLLYGNLYFGWNMADIGTSALEYERKSKNESGLSYGLGIEYWIPIGVSIQANYMRYFENLDAIEVGFGLKF